MNNKAKGSARERRVKELMIRYGWVVYKAGGSLGNADLVALRADVYPLLIQVKGTAAGPFSGFPPHERYLLEKEARKAGAVPLLAHWPPRGSLKWYVGPSWGPVDFDELLRENGR